MGLTRSLTAGSSSLRAHQQRLDVISNNIANSNTIGYKSGRATFSEQFNQIYSLGKSPDLVGTKGVGGMNPLQYGLGVKLGSVTLDMSQGILEMTNRPLDMALQGDGFFVYGLNGRQHFSRAGAVTRDKDGYLVDSSTGALLQGYNVELDASGRIFKNSDGSNRLNGMVDNMRIAPSLKSPPNQTQNVRLIGNLDSETEEGEIRATSINIFDNLGTPRSLALTFTKTTTPNEYTVAVQIDGIDVNASASTVQFNDDGTLNTPLDLTITSADLNTALGSNVFANDVAVALAEADNLLGGLTQFAGSSNATATEQDGYQSGDLTGLSVDNVGKIWGSFTNGQSEVLGQVVIAKFTNQAGLKKEGNNFFSVSPNSGLANIGTAGDIFPSTTIAGAALEESNVEITREFTDMISTQRAYEAAARTVTVSDQLLAEANQLKR